MKSSKDLHHQLKHLDLQIDERAQLLRRGQAIWGLWNREKFRELWKHGEP